MKLTNKIVVTEKFTGTSKFCFWKNLEVGDVLIVEMVLEPTGHNRGRIYAPEISIKNLRTKNVFKDTINSFQKYLGKIQFVDFRL